MEANPELFLVAYPAVEADCFSKSKAAFEEVIDCDRTLIVRLDQNAIITRDEDRLDTIHWRTPARILFVQDALACSARVALV